MCLQMYIYIYIYIYMRVCVYVCVNIYIYVCVYVCVWGFLELRLSSSQMDTATWVHIVDEFVCISYCTSALGKVTNPTILPPAMGK